MKKLLPLLAFLTLFSCKDDTVKPVTGTEIKNAEETVDTSKTTTPSKEKDIEQTIADLQAAIEKAAPEDRRELIIKYLGYGPQMDGAVAEAYSSFAFEYEQQHTSDFYSVLSGEDADIVKQWADEAASEVAIQVETEADAEAFFQNLQDINPGKRDLLNDTQKKLFDQYHKQLEGTSYSLIRN